jgi:hypothetical protein
LRKYFKCKENEKKGISIRQESFNFLNDANEKSGISADD